MYVCDSIADLASLMTNESPEQNYVRSDRVSSLHWDAILEELPTFLDQALDNNPNSRTVK